jgi:hypothetical protein
VSLAVSVCRAPGFKIFRSYLAGVQVAGQDAELEVKRLCYRCVGEAYLHAEIEREGVRGTCSYCGQHATSYTIEDMADRIETVFEQHYRRTPDQPDSFQQSLFSDPESTYYWTRDGDPAVDAIMNSADMPQEAAEDIQAILEDRYSNRHADEAGEETEFSSDSHYEEKAASDQAWQEEWREFERSLKTEARFFSSSAAAHLASVFAGIEKMRATDGRPLVMEAGPDTTLTAIYRARVFQSSENLEAALCRPDQQLGSPPAILATAGRMNAQGISVFYGANEPGVAIAEVRPPVGSQVAVAQFNIIRRLRLLDLTALSAVSEGGSVFDPGLAGRLERATFFGSLSQRLTRPVMPNDEVLDYLPTQAIADFLATQNEPQLDGIVFPSVQIAGDALNVVLFHKAARVEALDIPPGTEISTISGYSDGDGWQEGYSVIERVPKKKEPEKEPEEKPEDHGWPDLDALEAFTPGPWLPEDSDARQATLRVDLGSVKVHVVRAVQFNCEEHEVSRHRWEKEDRPAS